MLNAVIAVSSVITLALLLLGIRVLAAMHRRIRRLERQERDRATLRRIVNTPREDADATLDAPQPQRRRCHLSLYRGGGAAAALIGIGGAARRSVGITTTAGAVAVAGVATTVCITAPRDGGADAPQPTPRAVSTAPRTPAATHTQSGGREQRPQPSATPSPSRPTSPSPTTRPPRASSPPPPSPSSTERNVPVVERPVPRLPAEAGVTVAPRNSDDTLVDAEVREGRLCLHAAVTKLLATKVCTGR